MITQEELKKFLSYDKQTGEFYWMVNKGPTARKGGLFGSDCNGYRYGTINRKRYYLHRLAFLFMEGVIPPNVDHKNRNKSDNSWDNLRSSTQSENLANTTIRKDNTSGFKGVHWNKRSKKWQSRICFEGKRLTVGFYTCKYRAAIAYNRKAIVVFGEFANLNMIIDA